MRKINIAIDGPSGAGKSSTARLVSKKLNFNYLDTGAMYRIITWYWLEKLDLNLDNLISDLKNIKINVSYDSNGKQITLINEFNPNLELYSNIVNNYVSFIASQAILREFLVSKQQEICYNNGFVVDGRDIATVVLPYAELKIFLNAPVDLRAMRRQIELEEMGQFVSIDEIKENLIKRDKIDSTRENSPLIKHKDAIEIDSSKYTIDEQVDLIVNLANKIINNS